MKEIVLYRNKGVALVDDADYEWLSQYKWHIDRGYAAMTIKEPTKGIMYMHRLINKTPKGMLTDHRNGNKLDNRRENLRTCTFAQNNANSKKRPDNTSGVKGVVWHKRMQKWQAQISVGGKCVYLGMYDDKDEACNARRLGAIKYHGEFASVHL